MNKKKELGIIGTGNMGAALLKGIIEANIIQKDKIHIFDIDKVKLQEISEKFEVDIATDNVSLVEDSEYILLAVKPQVISRVLEEIKDFLGEEQLLISIAAGISIAFIQDILQKEIPIIRIMPNTPALIGFGAAALTTNPLVAQKDKEKVKQLLNAVGIVVELEEKYMDAVTGLSGSGPAYVFIIIEALSDAGVKMGLSRDIALKLATQTVLGAAKMVSETGKHPGELKDMVTSPGGTTISALHALEKGKLRATLIDAVEVATNKSKTLK